MSWSFWQFSLPNEWKSKKTIVILLFWTLCFELLKEAPISFTFLIDFWLEKVKWAEASDKFHSGLYEASANFTFLIDFWLEKVKWAEASDHFQGLYNFGLWRDMEFLWAL